MCWSCAQPQTTVQARAHPAPTSLDEFAESVDARYVNQEGDLEHDKWMQKGSEDLTSTWKHQVPVRS
jgi:hypothetical protein